MAGNREALDIPAFDSLDDFDPPKGRPAKPAPAAPDKPAPKRAPTATSGRARQAVDRASSFPSREAPDEGQLNMRGPNAVLDRFKALCKADRRKYADMLEILMDLYDEQADKT